MHGAPALCRFLGFFLRTQALEPQIQEESGSCPSKGTGGLELCCHKSDTGWRSTFQIMVPTSFLFNWRNGEDAGVR